MAATKRKRAKGVTWKSLPGGEEGLLLQLKTGDYFTVNEVGLKVWEMAEGKTDEQIAAALARKFDVSAEAALKDTRTYCRQLERAGLLISN